MVLNFVKVLFVCLCRLWAARNIVVAYARSGDPEQEEAVWGAVATNDPTIRRIPSAKRWTAREAANAVLSEN